MSTIVFFDNQNNEEKMQEINENTKNLNKTNADANSNINRLEYLDGVSKENIKNATDIDNKLLNNTNNAIQIDNKLLNDINNAVQTDNKLKEDNNIAVNTNMNLNSSIDSAKKYINSLDSSQNLPKIRYDLNELQDQFNNSKMLNYTGSNIICKNSLAGRTSNMKLYGRTLQNLIKLPSNFNENGIITDGTILTIVGNGGYPTLNYDTSLFKVNTKYTLFVDVKELNNISETAWCLFRIGQGDGKVNTIVPNPTSTGLYKVTFTTPSNITMADTFMRPNANGYTVKLDKLRIIEGEIEYVDYFEGIKNVGNKINILSINNTDNKAPNYKECIKTITLSQGQEFNGLKDVQDTIEETDRCVEYTQRIGKRAYQTDDENLENVMTDKVNTYYVLDKPIKTILKGVEETDVDTYNIITYIKCSNIIPASLNFNISANYGSLIQNNGKNINTLYKNMNIVTVQTSINSMGILKNSQQILKNDSDIQNNKDNINKAISQLGDKIIISEERPSHENEKIWIQTNSTTSNNINATFNQNDNNIYKTIFPKTVAEQVLYKDGESLQSKFDKKNKLWEGLLLMTQGDIVPLSKPLDQCQNGIVLYWSDYDADTKTKNDFNWAITLILKNAPYVNSGNILIEVASNKDGSNTVKALFIKNDRIEGGSDTAAPNYDDVVLREIWEF